MEGITFTCRSEMMRNKSKKQYRCQTLINDSNVKNWLHLWPGAEFYSTSSVLHCCLYFHSSKNLYHSLVDHLSLEWSYSLQMCCTRYDFHLQRSYSYKSWHHPTPQCTSLCLTWGVQVSRADPPTNLSGHRFCLRGPRALWEETYISKHLDGFITFQIILSLILKNIRISSQIIVKWILRRF